MSNRFGEPRIVHQDEHLMVLYKPPGLATTAPDEGECLVTHANRLDPKAPRLHPTSRLDAEVSGLVTFARTPLATRELIEARNTKVYHRRYLAITSSALDMGLAGEWTGRIGICPRDPRRRLADEGKAQKDARTFYRFGECAGPGRLLHLWPDTGRTHQLRVHAQAAGVSLFGDLHYGGDKRWTLPSGRVVRAGRTMLHCYALVIPAIGRSGKLELRCPPPDDFTLVWSRLGGQQHALGALDNEPVARVKP